jgi:hypothetical protein
MASPAARAVPSPQKRIASVSRYATGGAHGVEEYQRSPTWLAHRPPDYFSIENEVLVGWVAELSPTAIR